MFPDRWQANSFEREFPGARLEHLVAAHDQYRVRGGGAPPARPDAH
ncbi:hypothetical protein ACLGIH_01755 [Streptomyces sp. HMX87]